MSLESKIELLTAAVVHLTVAIEQANGLKPVADQIAEKAAAPTPVTVTPLPPVAPTPAVSAPVAPAPVTTMPAPPVFASAPAPAANALPFTDANSLVAYVMGVYKQIGPQKGAGIQNVLNGLGVVNLTDVKPEMYAQFYAGVEALKV